MCGEFVGTVLFLYFALSGAQVANSVNTSSGQSIAETGSNPQQLQYIALSFGFSLAVNAGSSSVSVVDSSTPLSLLACA
jgi:aquaporin related protein